MSPGAYYISDEKQLVVFWLVQEEFGVDIENVKEIVRLPDITPIPRSPEYVAGICNLRGNVLPVIDTRLRFSLNSEESTDHSRLLVVESGGVQTSLMVDSVREVMRMQNLQEEPPPAACRGVDRQFLSSVVKVDQGERLVLKLDLSEVLSIDLRDGTTQNAGREQFGAEGIQETGAEKGAIEEEQLVSFKVAGDEYAFDIDKVREIINLAEVTAVPNVPDYVKGLLTIRNHLLPIIDLRELLGLPNMVAERHAILDRAVAEHREWGENLQHVLEAGSHFTGDLNPRETPFGVWLEGYNTASAEIENMIKRLKKRRGDLYASAARVLEMRQAASREEVLTFFKETTLPLMEIVFDTLAKFKRVMDQHILEDQRALVVESGAMSIGYLVDWVDEVLRIPRSVIDTTPVMASSDRKEIKAVAKMNKGERLIMIMDESALVSHETSQMISDQLRKEGTETGESSQEKAEKSLAQQSMDEEQLVTFTINNEEYGVRIMQVHEINRISDITVVPRAPYFVDGMTSLRGNVVPVLNIRKLFALEDREIDDRTRIIIVDIGGNKTGLRVDKVNEVLRLNKQDIVQTPNIVISEGANAYMEGVCKIDEGKRIVVLLNVGKILDEDELSKLREVVDGPDSGFSGESSRFETKTTSAGEESKKLETPDKGLSAPEPATLPLEEDVAPKPRKLEPPGGKKLEIAE